jgi:hypothetical protein
MAMSIKITSEPKFLHAVVTGEFSLEESQKIFLELLNAVKMYRSTRVLFDGLGITGEPETMERFFYCDFIASSILDLRKSGDFALPWFAYVFKKPVLDPDKFGETVALNRGMIVKIFDNIGEAIDWLQLN